MIAASRTDLKNVDSLDMSRFSGIVDQPLFIFQLKLLLIVVAFILGSLLLLSLIHLGKQINNYPNLELKLKFLRKSD